MCGSTDQQQQISQAQQQMYQTLNQNYATAFAQQQNIVNSLTSTFQPILARGPYQTGYSPAQVTGLNTAASENIAQQYAQAQRAAARVLAAQGGDTMLPSSIQANTMANIATQAAGQRAQALNQNMIQNYNMGYQNWQNAANVLGNVATNMVNPNQFASSATSAGAQAANTANQIAQQQNSVWNAAIGALGGIGGAALGGFMTPRLPNISSVNTENPWSVSPIIQNYQSSQAAINALANPTIAGNLMPGSIPNLTTPSWGGVPYA
jgi:hypothetical protein